LKHQSLASRRQAEAETAIVLLQRRKEIPRGELSTSCSDAVADERLSRRRFPIRFWLYRLRQLRERGGRQDWRAANAQAKRRSRRRPCRPCGRLGRQERALRRAPFMALELRLNWLFNPASL